MDFMKGDTVTIVKPGSTASWHGNIMDWEDTGITIRAVTQKGKDVVMFFPWGGGYIVAKENVQKSEEF